MEEYKQIKNLGDSANQGTIKSTNRELVFDVLNAVGRCSRTQLAKMTGLTKTSITNITGEMIEGRIIREGKTTGEGVGRKQVLLEISSDSPRAIGVSINRSAVFICLENLKGEMLYQKGIPLAATETTKSFLKKVFDGCRGAIAANGDNPLLGIGVASIGPLDLKAGTILSPPNFKGLKNIAIVSALKEQFGLAVYLDNDMNASAIMEKLFGYGKGLNNFIYVGVTQGVGAGVVYDRKLYAGSNGFAGEIGHISIDHRGRPCQCGSRGCLETYASIPVIEQEAEKRLAQGAQSSLAARKKVRWEDIVRAAKEGDALANELIGKMVDYLAAAFVTLCNMHDPEVIFLGHEIVVAGDLVIRPLKEKVNRMIFSKEFSEVDIKISYSKDKAYEYNGAAVLINKYINGEMTA